MSNLVNRCVIDDPTCPHCTNQHEDVLHALWYWPSVSSIRDEDPQRNFRRNMSFSDFPQLLSDVLDSDCSPEFFSMLTRTIWFRCNKVRFSPSGFPLDQVLQQAITSLLEFRVAQPKRQSPTTRPRASWTAPLGEIYKINFDGAVLTDEDRAGIGVIIRDSQGMVMASMSHNITLPISVVELKTLAAAKALEFSIDLGFVSAIFEGDSKIVMKALMDDSPSLASFGLLIRDVKTYVEQYQY
uniref:RNase H type-1 domain-containing protein n=1 Tax=Quercus lobata TaxID=97700 RepID=A0A7N2MVZ4_QUELO